MNTSIISVDEKTLDNKVYELTQRLIRWRGKRVNVSFTKKDGTLRNMTIVPRNSWNEINGRSLTRQGKKMIETKCNHGMVSVVEMLEDGVIQPRTINLNTVQTMELA